MRTLRSRGERTYSLQYVEIPGIRWKNFYVILPTTEQAIGQSRTSIFCNLPLLSLLLVMFKSLNFVIVVKAECNTCDRVASQKFPNLNLRLENFKLQTRWSA